MARRLLTWGAPGTYLIAVLSIAAMLIGVLVRSPDTRSNFQASPEGYTRTDVTTVGATAQYEGLALGDFSGGLRDLYVGAGCAGCHGLSGEGSTVGPEIWDHDLDAIRTALREGEFGMPAYSEAALSDREVGALTTYLNELWEAAGSPEPTKPDSDGADGDGDDPGPQGGDTS